MSCFPGLRVKCGVLFELHHVGHLVLPEYQSFDQQAPKDASYRSLFCFCSFPTSSMYFPGFDLRSAQVVSLATGTKCLDSHNVSDQGGTLSDCHAEVVSRRALVRFLYAQLELLLWYDPEPQTLTYFMLQSFSFSLLSNLEEEFAFRFVF